MKKKLLLLALSVIIIVAAFAGCSSKAPANDTTTSTAPAQESAAPAKDSTASNETAAPSDTSGKTDVVSSASQVNDEAAFEQKISKDNTNYMIIVNKDLTFTKDLIVESGVKKGKDGNEAPNRSIAPAKETADQKITDRYTITVPNLVFAGENGKIEYGIVKGDVYVQAKGFILKDATIDGNLYFATEDLKNAFKQDETTKITGTVGVKEYKAN